MKNRVFITRNILPEGPDLLREYGLEVEVNNLNRPLTYDELNEHARSVDALITMLTDQIDKNFLENNSHLKVISNYAVGFNNIDIKTAGRLKIPIGNTPDVLTEATAEVAMGLMICAARNFNSSRSAAVQGHWRDWNPTGHLGHSLKGKTLGIVGLGRIGFRLADMCANAFGMNILYTSQTAKEHSFQASKVELDQLLQESDFVSIHMPLNNQTRKLIGKNELNKLKKSAVLINTARGEIVDQEALIVALREKRIFAAGLDVTDPEPLPVESELFKLENAIVLPHIGSASFEARRAMSIMCAENIIAGLEGRKLVTWVNKSDLLP